MEALEDLALVVVLVGGFVGLGDFEELPELGLVEG